MMIIISESQKTHIYTTIILLATKKQRTTATQEQPAKDGRVQQGSICTYRNFPK